MIPSASGFLPQDFVIKEQPSTTYSMDMENSRIRGVNDDVEAIKQAIFKILNTERYQYVIYSWDYGIETADLYGKDTLYAMAELERRISEALLCDSRIKSVDNFEFSSKKGKISCTFTVNTIFGEVNAERTVDI